MKKLSVRVGEYVKDNETKGRYVNIGVIMQKEGGGEYVLLDPHISLAGLMAQQNTEAMKKGEQLRDRVLAGVFEEQSQQNGYQQPQQAPQQTQQSYPQQAPQQGNGHTHQQNPQNNNYGGHRG